VVHPPADPSLPRPGDDGAEIETWLHRRPGKNSSFEEMNGLREITDSPVLTPRFNTAEPERAVNLYLPALDTLIF